MTVVSSADGTTASRTSGVVALVLAVLYLAIAALYVVAQVNGVAWAATHVWPEVVANAVIPLGVVTFGTSVWAITRGGSNRVIGIVACIAVLVPAVLLVAAIIVGSQAY
jgi:hypothetical protein